MAALQSTTHVVLPVKLKDLFNFFKKNQSVRDTSQLSGRCSRSEINFKLLEMSYFLYIGGFVWLGFFSVECNDFEVNHLTFSLAAGEHRCYWL